VIVPFKADHLAALELQPSQAHMAGWLTQELAVTLERVSTAATAMHNGRPVACAGLTDVEGRRTAWAFLGAMARPVMVEATRACLAMVSRETSDIFTHVRTDLPANTRWLRLLGFATTGRLETMPDGMDYELWVRANV
jgi:hypothetical protein